VSASLVVASELAATAEAALAAGRDWQEWLVRREEWSFFFSGVIRCYKMFRLVVPPM